MEDLSLHILDIAENSAKAGARRIDIIIRENRADDLLTIEISDDGEGMDAAAVARAEDPFYTTRTTRRVGLGLPMLAEASRAADGTLEVRSAPGRGTKVCATFRLSHIDRKPLGNMAQTVATLVAGRPDIELTYSHEREGKTVSFSTAEVRLHLGDLPLNSVETLSFIARFLTQEEDSL